MRRECQPDAPNTVNNALARAGAVLAMTGSVYPPPSLVCQIIMASPAWGSATARRQGDE